MYREVDPTQSMLRFLEARTLRGGTAADRYIVPEEKVSIALVVPDLSVTGVVAAKEGAPLCEVAVTRADSFRVIPHNLVEFIEPNMSSETLLDKLLSVQVIEERHLASTKLDIKNVVVTDRARPIPHFTVFSIEHARDLLDAASQQMPEIRDTEKFVELLEKLQREEGLEENQEVRFERPDLHAA